MSDYGEPWKIVYHNDERWTSVLERDGSLVAGPSEQIGERMVACVNACDGIANPAAVPEVVEALRATRRIIGTELGDRCYAPFLAQQIDAALRKLDGDDEP